MSFLQLKDKWFLVTGVANKKSVAYFVAQTLLEEGAQIIFSVQSEEHQQKAKSLFPKNQVLICDLADEKQVENLARTLSEQNIILDGLLHSVAYAKFSADTKYFHQTPTQDFQNALHISAWSLTILARELKDILNEKASVVTISISNTKATSYGYMGPIKVLLESTTHYLAKSFSHFSQIRFNSVCAGPLKTAASAAIPSYMDNYLYSEQLTLRKKNLETQEVADAVVYLLSPRSSGINATGILVDAGMNVNYFDEKIVKEVSKNLY